MVAVDLDLSARTDARTDGDLREDTNHDESLAPTGHEHLHDAEAVLAIFERDPLDLALDRDLCGLRHRHPGDPNHKTPAARRSLFASRAESIQSRR